MIGWIKLHRKLADKAFYTKDSEMVHLWVHLLISANHKDREESLGGKTIKCNPGQFTTGRKQLSKETGISESKIERILFKFEKIEQQIEQQKTTTNRLISILNWHEYQQSEQQSEQQPDNDRTTSEQRVDTPKEEEELKKSDKVNKFIKPTLQEIESYCFERGNNVDANKFFNYYESNGWKVGRNSMKDWKATVRTWESNNFNQPQQNGKTTEFGSRIEENMHIYANIQRRLEEERRMENEQH